MLHTGAELPVTVVLQNLLEQCFPEETAERFAEVHMHAAAPPLLRPAAPLRVLRLSSASQRSPVCIRLWGGAGACGCRAPRRGEGSAGVRDGPGAARGEGGAQHLRAAVPAHGAAVHAGRPPHGHDLRRGGAPLPTRTHHIGVTSAGTN